MRSAIVAIFLFGIMAASFSCEMPTSGGRHSVANHDLFGTWRGDLQPPGWMGSRLAPSQQSHLSTITFKPGLWFAMTTREGKSIDHTGGQYTIKGSVLSLNYGDYSGQPLKLRYRITLSGNVLKLQALESINAPPSATLTRVAKNKAKHPRRAPSKSSRATPTLSAFAPSQYNSGIACLQENQNEPRLLRCTLSP